MYSKKPDIYRTISSITDTLISDFIDSYQCVDWNMTAQQFAEQLIKYATREIQAVAKELDTPEEEE